MQGMREVIARAALAHYTDVVLRINNTEERYEADWIKHLKEVEAVE